jgi:hypothetical protein
MPGEGADDNRLAGLLVRIQQVRLQLMDRCTAVLQHCDERRKLLAALQQRQNRPRFDAGIFKKSDPAADHFKFVDRGGAGAPASYVPSNPLCRTFWGNHPHTYYTTSRSSVSASPTSVVSASDSTVIIEESLASATLTRMEGTRESLRCRRMHYNKDFDVKSNHHAFQVQCSV